MGVLDILTIDEAQAAIRSDADAHLADLEVMVSGISAQIDDLCGPVVVREVVETHHGGWTALSLNATPILSVEEVIETTGVTPATLVAADYSLVREGQHYRLHRRASGYDRAWVGGTRNVQVTLNAGRYETTEDVEPKWKQVAASILRYQWQQEAGAWTRSPTAYDDYDNGGEPPFLSVDDMVRRRLPGEMLPLGIG